MVSGGLLFGESIGTIRGREGGAVSRKGKGQGQAQ